MMSIRHDVTRHRHQHGTAAIELAIALPVLLLVLLATAELGRMFDQSNTLAKAVRSGARYVAANALAGSTGVVSIDSSVAAQAARLVVTGAPSGSGDPLLPGLSTSAVTVADAGNGNISVSVTYTYQPLVAAALPTFGFGASIPLAIPLTAQTIMRVL